MSRRPVATAALLALLATAAHGASVRVEHGNVVYVNDAGEPRALGSEGLDADPALSPDGKIIVFVRDTPGRSFSAGAGQAHATQLRAMRIDGRGERLLVDGHPGEDPKRTLAGLHQPQFSPDGRWVYFLSAAWATSDAIHVVDLRDAKERFVIDGNSLAVVKAGRHAAALRVTRHKVRAAGGSYEWTGLVTPTGKEIKTLGVDGGQPGAQRPKK